MTSAPPLADPYAAAVIHDLLRGAGFSVEGIQRSVGTSGERLAIGSDRPVYLRRLTGDDALATLIRLFILDSDVEEDRVDTALGGSALDALGALRLVEREGGVVRATARLVPHEDLVIASDRPDREGRRDHVPGMQRPSALLSHLTVRSPVSNALDVGTGCGIQAILASRHSERVVAADVSERALAFAGLNVALNGIENVELRRGSYLEPVRGERYDLVVANPPYVVSPESAYFFRDSGLGRDRVSEQLARELPSVLAEGGFATVMVSWVHAPDSDLPRPAGWVGDAGVDALVLHTGTEDPLTTAAAWNRDLADDEEAYGRAIDRWVEYYESEGIPALAYGAIVMRRRTATRNWVRPLQLPLRPAAPADRHLRRLFAAHDLLEDLEDDRELLGLAFRVANGAVLEQRGERTAEGWTGAEISLKLEEGLRFSASLDPQVAVVVSALDGERPLGDVLALVAEDQGIDEATLVDGGVRLARMMLEAGFLVHVPAEGG